MTLRFTSPQAAMVSSIASFSAWIARRRLLLMMPWNWMVWRVVRRSVPLPRSRAMVSAASHCCGVRMPPGTRIRAMKMKAFSIFLRPRSARRSRSSCT